jgi:hypothetical protein
MDKKIIKSLIDEKLDVIREQFSIIREYDGKIPNIELDLLMSSIRDLYELVLSLQSENMGSMAPKPFPQKERPKAVPEPEPQQIRRFSSGIISMEPVMEEEPPVVIPPVVKDEPVIPEPVIPEPVIPEEEIAGEEIPEEIIKEPEIVQPVEQERPQRINYDLFTENAIPTLADRYKKEEQEKRLADKFQEDKITDLRTSIGINDKFLFINELFDGNMRIYDEAILKLNAASTMAQADLQLLDFKIVYNWDSESPTVKKFVELVRRKF